MQFLKMVRTFDRAEDGAVTLDWVVLTAAIVGLAIAALAAVRGGADAASTRISARLSSQTGQTTF
jgi:hypothetical protein